MSALEAAKAQLGPPRHAGPFQLWFRERNPRTGSGASGNGVDGDKLIACYANALKRALTRFQAKPHERALPFKPVPVYILDIQALPEGTPFMSVNTAGDPFIVLPSRIAQYTPHAELDYAAASAVHEFLHVLRHVVRPFTDLFDLTYWRWFDEATAVWAERLVMHGNRACFEYFLDWSDRPEVSLDTDFQSYGGALFVHYLAVHYGEGLISKVWTDARLDETPIETIARLLPKRRNEGIFHAYCADSYFAQDAKGATPFAEVHDQYGGRAVTESFATAKGSTYSITGEVLPLACRFYRFYPAPGVTRIAANLKSHANGVRASLAGAGQRLSRTVQAARGPLLNIEKGQVDHVVMVVSNDGRDKSADPKITIDVSVD